MDRFDILKNILISVLGIDKDKSKFSHLDKLFGGIPEFDSLAVVSVIEAIEDQFDIIIDDDEVDAEIFETFGSLLAFVEKKVS